MEEWKDGRMGWKGGAPIFQSSIPPTHSFHSSIPPTHSFHSSTPIFHPSIPPLPFLPSHFSYLRIANRPKA